MRCNKGMDGFEHTLAGSQSNFVNTTSLHAKLIQQLVQEERNSIHNTHTSRLPFEVHCTTDEYSWLVLDVLDEAVTE